MSKRIRQRCKLGVCCNTICGSSQWDIHCCDGAGADLLEYVRYSELRLVLIRVKELFDVLK